MRIIHAKHDRELARVCECIVDQETMQDLCTIMRQMHRTIRLVAHPDTSNSKSTLMTLIRSTSRRWRYSYALLSARILLRHRSIYRRSLQLVTKIS